MCDNRAEDKRCFERIKQANKAITCNFFFSHSIQNHSVSFQCVRMHPSHLMKLKHFVLHGNRCNLHLSCLPANVLDTVVFCWRVSGNNEKLNTKPFNIPFSFPPNFPEIGFYTEETTFFETNGACDQIEQIKKIGEKKLYFRCITRGAQVLKMHAIQWCHIK